MAAKYVLWGAGDYGKRLFRGIDSSLILCFVDNTKAGTELCGKKIIAASALEKMKAPIIIVIAVENKKYMREIQKQLDDMYLPYMFAAEFLFQFHITRLDIYPIEIRLLIRLFGITRLPELSDVEKKKELVIEKRYSKITIWHVQSANISAFCYSFAEFCETRDQCLDTDTLYCIIPSNYADRDEKNIPYKTYNIPNEFLYKKFSEICITLNESNINFWCYYICSHWRQIDFFVYEDLRKANVQTSYAYVKDPDNYKKFAMPCIDFSKSEKEMGEILSRSLGIENEYVCFYSRDNSYLQSTNINISLEEPIMQCDAFRNSDVNQYAFMASELYKRGIQSVRMGSIVEKEYIGIGIDYSNLAQSEFMDAYLFSKCLFFISDSSGIIAIPKCMFGKPVVAIVSPYTLIFKGDLVTPMDLLLFRKMYIRGKHDFLTFRTLMEINVSMGFDINKILKRYCDLGIMSAPAQPEEIWEAAQEMLTILDGTQEYSQEDIELREKYYQIIREYFLQDDNLIVDTGAPCASWLRKNQWFLG